MPKPYFEAFASYDAGPNTFGVATRYDEQSCNEVAKANVKAKLKTLSTGSASVDIIKVDPMAKLSERRKLVSRFVVLDI